jgi:hypothetical protein
MKITAFVFFILFLMISCEKEKEITGAGQQIYFNSFESQSDTIGWKGYAFRFADDTPEHGGSGSLLVSGGCIIPHAQYTLPPQNSDSYMTLKFWGKNLSNGGGVFLSVNKPGYKPLSFDVSGKDWTLYENHDSLFCPANASLTLGITAGGIIGSSILIDMIEIRKLDTGN